MSGRRAQRPPATARPCAACAGRQRANDVLIVRAVGSLREELAIALGTADGLKAEIGQQRARIARQRAVLAALPPAIVAVLGEELGLEKERAEELAKQITTAASYLPHPDDARE